MIKTTYDVIFGVRYIFTDDDPRMEQYYALAEKSYEKIRQTQNPQKKLFQCAKNTKSK